MKEPQLDGHGSSISSLLASLALSFTEAEEEARHGLVLPMWNCLVKDGHTQFEVPSPRCHYCAIKTRNLQHYTMSDVLEYQDKKIFSHDDAAKRLEVLTAPYC